MFERYLTTERSTATNYMCHIVHVVCTLLEVYFYPLLRRGIQDRHLNQRR